MINEKMAQDLVALGIKENDTVLVHASLSSLGFVEGGADTVIDTLISVLKDGTLLMPTLSFDSVTVSEPVFSVNDTPSCVGKISETFRKRAGVIRSMHPTHSVAAYGKNTSPFSLLPKYNGKVLMLGCTLSPNTSMHGVEELINPDYLLCPEMTEYILIDKDGKEIKKKYWRHFFHAPGYSAEQRYQRLANLMDIPVGKVLCADAYLIDAQTMWEKGYEALKRDNHYFVEIFE